MADARDLDLIARTIIGEAGKEPPIGQAAVAHVIRNRLMSGGYGESVPDVLFARRQFEPWDSRRSELLSYSPNSPVYQQASAIAELVLGGKVPDPTGGATHFYGPRSQAALGRKPPSWDNGSGQDIGGHRFFKLGNGPGQTGSAFPNDLELVEDGAAPAKTAGREAIPDDLVPADLEPAGPAPLVAENEDQVRAAEVATGMAQPIAKSEVLGRGLAKGFLANLTDEANAAAAASPLPGAEAVDRTRPYLPHPFDVAAGAARLGMEKLAPGTFGSEGGQRYDARLAEERARDTQMMRESPIASVAGQVGGALINPVSSIPLAAATRGQAALRAGLAGGAVGAASGFGAGEGGPANRAIEAAKGGAVGAAVGAPLGAALGVTAPATAGNAVIEAADRLGVAVPKVAATDSAALQQIGKLSSNVPLAGDPLMQASQRAVEGLSGAVQETAQSAGGASMEQAGAVGLRGIRDWITGDSKALVTKAYDAVDSAINPSVTTDLNQTRTVVADIAARRQNARLGDSKAVNHVLDAVQTPGGLNYFGVKDMRSSVGEMLDKGILPEGMSATELKRLYGALSDDLRSSVQNAGGPRAAQLFERANTLNAKVAARREKLAEVVGAKGDATPAEVFSRLKAAATSTSRADSALLAQSRRVMGNDWDEVVSGMIGQLGQNRKGEFSPQIFLNDYAKLSDRGKNLLLSPALRQPLDDIAAVSSRFNKLERFANPSGTGRQLGWGAIVTGMATEPFTTVASLVGGNVASRILASPATANSMAKWAKAYEATVRQPAAGTFKALETAGRQFSSTLADKLGVTLDPAALMGGLRSAGAAQQDEGNNRQR